MRARRLLALAALCCLAAGAARAQISDDVVKIGVLTDMTSPRAARAGEGSVVAARMAAADFGGTVAGKPIAVIAADHLNKPDVGAAIARQWLDQDHVDAIAEASRSDVALAVQRVARERGKIVLFAGPGSPALTGKDCSPTGIAWTYDAAALARGAAAALAKEGAESWFLLTAEGDAAAAQRAVTAAGGKVLGTAPLADGAAALRKAAASRAKVVAIAGGGPEALAAALPADWLGKGQRLLALRVFISEINNLGLSKAQGLLLVSPFYWDQNDETRAWAKRFRAESKDISTMIQAGIYTAVTHYLKAVAAAGTDDATAVAARMRALPIDDFMTRNGRLRQDGSVARDLYLFQVKPPAESKYPGDDYKQLAAIPAAAAFPAVSDDCPLVRSSPPPLAGEGREGATQ